MPITEVKVPKQFQRCERDFEARGLETDHAGEDERGEGFDGCEYQREYHEETIWRYLRVDDTRTSLCRWGYEQVMVMQDLVRIDLR